MKRYNNVQAITELDGKILTVTVLDYDRDKYCNILLPDGTYRYVKKYSLTNLPQGFNFYLLPYDYKQGITSKEIAEDLRKHKRYHFKIFSPCKVEMRVNFYKDSSLKELAYTFKGNRQQIVKHFYSLPKGTIDNFTLSLSFYNKCGSSFGSCFKYVDRKQTVYSFRNKKQDKFIKQLLRSLFRIQVKG